jgi:hypothetical protein
VGQQHARVACEEGGPCLDVCATFGFHLWLYLSAGGAVRVGQQHARAACEEGGPCLDVCATFGHTFGFIFPQGELYVWGSNTRGQLAKKEDHA